MEFVFLFLSLYVLYCVCDAQIVLRMFCILTIKHIHCSIVHPHSNSGKLTRSTIPRENSIFATMRGKNKWMNMLFSELLWRECATPTVNTFGYFYFVSFEAALLLLIAYCVHKCLLLTLWLIAIFFFPFIFFHCISLKSFCVAYRTGGIWNFNEKLGTTEPYESYFGESAFSRKHLTSTIIA